MSFARTSIGPALGSPSVGEDVIPVASTALKYSQRSKDESQSGIANSFTADVVAFDLMSFRMATNSSALDKVSV
jgi:hypothetical protein